MGLVADGDVLAHDQFEIAAARRGEQYSLNGVTPHNVPVNDVPNYPVEWISGLGALNEGVISVRTEDERVGPSNAGQAQTFNGGGYDARVVLEFFRKTKRLVHRAFLYSAAMAFCESFVDRALPL